MASAEAVPEVLRAIRANLEFTQTELAERLGVSFATVNRWEGDDGRTRPQKAKLARILALVEAGPSVRPCRSGRSRSSAEGPPTLVNGLLGVVGDVSQRRSLGRVRSNCP